MNYKNVLVHLLILSIFNYTCCSHSKILTGKDIEKKFRPGDKVNVKTKEGPRYKFILTAVSEDSIKGNNYSVATKDIVTIEQIYDSNNYDILFGILIGIGILILISNSFSIGSL